MQKTLTAQSAKANRRNNVLPEWATLLTDGERCALRLVQIHAIAAGKTDEFNAVMAELKKELERRLRRIKSKKAMR